STPERTTPDPNPPRSPGPRGVLVGRGRLPHALGQEPVDGFPVGARVQPLLLDPGVVVVTVLVALAAVADERDHAAADPFPEHPGHQVPHTPQVRSGGTTRGQTRVLLQVLHGRDTGRVRDRNHQIDHRGNETRLHTGTADPLDTRGHTRV